ncbi:MAG TPA: Asd/ArgC dimerization domain-containing protein [Candidatus Limnocylindrales bacterium]|nr:Asd/ArgC dimerization domain-containing protein [Candidatus Limnocylindrales bacterium]
MSPDRHAQRMVIAGASSLLGAELKAVLEESRFAGWDLRLVDEDEVAGTLTDANGEPALIQGVEEGCFDHARLVFFSGSRGFVKRNFQAALDAGAVVIDFTGEVRTNDHAAIPWFPKLDDYWGTQFPKEAPHFWIISPAGETAVSLTFGLRQLGLKRISFVFLRPVSDAGRAGIEELESQTGQLLSFQNIGRQVFDAQVAFNLLDCYGVASRQNLDAIRRAVRKEVSECLQNQGVVLPSVEVLHTPTFYGMAFSACAELDPGSGDVEGVCRACQQAGFAIMKEADASPSNVTVAGEAVIQMGIPRSDPGNCGTWWFWGAADNIRLPAWNAVKLAEKIAG